MFEGLTTRVDGMGVVPDDPVLLRALKPGHKQVLLSSAGLEEVHRIFRMPGIRFHANVMDAVGEPNIFDIPGKLEGRKAFWEEWDLKAGDLIVVDVAAARLEEWLPGVLPQGAAVLNLPAGQAAALQLPQLASMVEAALRRGGILPRVEEVVQAGSEEMVLDLGT